MNLLVNKLKKEHWEEVGRIYLEGILTGSVKFECYIPSWEKWDATHLRKGRFVAILNGEIVGWIALSPVFDKKGQLNVGELSIYVDNVPEKEIINQRLISVVLDILDKERNIWTIQTVVFPDDRESISFFVKNGFKEIGSRKQLCKTNDVWNDVLVLERICEIPVLI